MHLSDLVTRYAIHSTEKQYRLAELVGERPWRVSLDAGRLSFGDDFAWAVQVLGTESYTTGPWLWSWGNRAAGLPESVLESAKALQAYGARNSVRELEDRTFDLAVASGYALSTVASGLLEAAAYYRAPFDEGAVYLLVTDPNYPREAPVHGATGSGPATARTIEAIRKALQSFEVDHLAALAAYAELRKGSLARQGAAATLTLGGRPRVRATLDAENRVERLEALD